MKYWKGSENVAADFLSRKENDPDDKYHSDEGVFVEIVSKNDDLGGQSVEVEMKNTSPHFLGHNFESNDKEYRQKIRRGAKFYMGWDVKLFRRQGRQARFIPYIADRVLILKAFHDDIGHWGRLPTKQFVTERFWWSGAIKYIY